MTIDVVQNVDGSMQFNIRYTAEALRQIGNSDIMIREIIKVMVDKIVDHHSAEIISKIDFQTVANLAAIELGKRAVPFVEKDGVNE